MLSWFAMWSVVWKTQSHTLQSFLLLWSVYGLMLGLRSASAVPGNINSMTLLNSEWSKKDYKHTIFTNQKTKKTQKNTSRPYHFPFDLCFSCNQLPGQSRPDWGSRLPAHRAGHPANPSEDHWYRWNPLHLQKPSFQVTHMETPQCQSSWRLGLCCWHFVLDYV